jgi:hypothetical protein
MIREKPSHRDAYIHARFHPETFREFDEPWGNKQNDATGALMWGIAQGIKYGKKILRDERDRRLVQAVGPGRADDGGQPVLRRCGGGQTERREQHAGSGQAAGEWRSHRAPLGGAGRLS